MPTLQITATHPAELPSFIALASGKDTEEALTNLGSAYESYDYLHNSPGEDAPDAWFIPYEEPNGVYAFVINTRLEMYKKSHPEGRRYYGPVDTIRKLYAYMPYTENYTVSLILNFNYLKSVLSGVPEERAELRIGFYFRQEGQLADGNFTDDTGQVTIDKEPLYTINNDKPYSEFTPPMHNITYPDRIFYIHFPTLGYRTTRDVEDFDSKDFSVYEDIGPTYPSYGFNDDGFYETQTLPAITIPVLSKGLKWFTNEEGYGDPQFGDHNDLGNLVADVNDSYIDIPSITAQFTYDFTGDEVSVIISSIKFNDVNEASPFFYSRIFLDTGHLNTDEDKRNRASIGFIGMHDNKGQSHGTLPTFWVRVNNSYAKAHPKEEVRKHGYFYYRNEGHGGWDNGVLIGTDEDFEYALYENDLKAFKESLDEYVNENYGGYDVPLPMPTLLKWSRYEHTGNDMALNIFVHPKGVL